MHFASELLFDEIAELCDCLLDAGRPWLCATQANAIPVTVGRREQRPGPERDLVAQGLAKQLFRVATFRQLHPQDKAACRTGDARAGGKMLCDCRGDVGHLVTKYAAQVTHMAVVPAGGKEIRNG